MEYTCIFIVDNRPFLWYTAKRVTKEKRGVIMSFLESLVSVANDYLWNYFLLFLLCGAGIYFTFRLRFVQVRRFGQSCKEVFGKIRFSGKKAGDDGMSSFQSLATAVAAQVGTGNLAGAATAIVMGGPGAIFWMWLSAFFGMATIFAEASLAQAHRTQKDGAVIGGPVYYIKAAFKGRFGRVLAVLFSVFIILALGFMGNMVQANSISSAFATAFGANKLVVGIVIAVLAGFVFIGGIRRIASLTEKIVPFMAVVYILGCAVALAFHAGSIGDAFRQIFVGAFSPTAVLGGACGIGVQKAMRYGVARGLFSNEAGMGSTPHAHALAQVEHPCQQGVVAMMGVFIDTFVVLTLTALVILTSGQYGSGADGIELTQAAFTATFGSFGNSFIAICLLFFAFSTIVGWFFFGQQNIVYLFGKKAVLPYALLVVGFIVLGSLLKLELVWSLADLFNGLMVIPNLLGLLALSGSASRLYRDYARSPLLAKAKKGRQ